MQPIPSTRRIQNTSGNEKPSNSEGEQVAPPEKRREGAIPRKEADSRVSREGDYFGGLEPYDGKLSRTVLRGERSRKAPDLPGVIKGDTI